MSDLVRSNGDWEDQLTTIAKDAVDEFFKDFAEEIEDGGKAYIKKMFNDKGPGSFDSIYLLGYDRHLVGHMDYDTKLNQLFCDAHDIDFDEFVKASDTSDTYAPFYDEYISFFDKATALAEEYAYTLL